MKKKWIKRILLLLLIPVLLFSSLIVCLYIPSVQNFIQRKAMTYVSEAIGMDISIGRVDLRFPLDLLLRDVAVIKEKDTVVAFERLNVRVQALPLLKKKILMDELTLKQTKLNTSSLIDGVIVNGNIGELKVVTREIDLESSFANISSLLLDKANLSIVLADTTTTKDSTETDIAWNILLSKIHLNQCKVALDMPLDTMSLNAYIPSLDVSKVNVNLADGDYQVGKIDLTESMLAYKVGSVFREKGFDTNNIQLSELSLSADSIGYNDSLIQVKIESLNLLEKSGVQVNSLSGKFSMSDETILCKNLLLRTPYSRFDFDLFFPINWCGDSRTTRVNGQLVLSLKELSTILGVEDSELDFSEWGPIMCKIDTEGNSEELKLNEVYAELSDSFIIAIEGAINNGCDEAKRIGQVDILGDLYDLTRFNKWLSDDGSIQLPLHMTVQGLAAVNGDKYFAELTFKESGGVVDVKGKYNSTSQEYEVRGDIDSLYISRFLPLQPLHNLSVDLVAKGRGVDFLSNSARADVQANLKNLTYGAMLLEKIGVNAHLESGKLSTVIESDNSIIKGDIDGYYFMNKPSLSLNYSVNVENIDLFQLGVLKRPLKEEVKLKANVFTDKDSIRLSLNSGDLDLNFSAEKSVNQLMDQSSALLESFLKQLKDRNVDYKDLQEQLPPAKLSWKSGNKNPLSSILKQNNISYLGSSADFSLDPFLGMKGWAGVQGFQLDSLKLDSLSLELAQDTMGIHLKTGVVNRGPKEETSFRTFIKGMLGKRDASVDIDFETIKGSKGLLFGVEFSPHPAGTQLILTPQEPVLAFKKFKFRDKKNWLFLRDDMRIFADIDMEEEKKVGFKVYSNLNDTVSLQNMNIDIRRIELNDVTRLFPFLPQLDGLFSAEAHYVQTDSTLQVSSELFLDSLKYEGKLVGDLGLGVTWLPEGAEADLLNMYLTHNRSEVVYADGMISKVKGKDILDVEATLEHFPLDIANVLFPNEEISLGGDIDGHLIITGLADAPIINGELILDSVTVFSKQAGAKFLLDSRPVPVKNSKIIFKDFSIYTTSDNPFKVNGTVDITNLADPKVNLKLKADDYTLLNAKHTSESVLYGKLFVDVDATLKGPISALKMRGNMSILDNTDITYVLTESPLTVQDRLGDLVTFTSFRDTTQVAQDSISHSLGGMDMVMSVHIDPSVQLKVDLSSDRSSRVALQGGGDLSLQYTPQGDFYLIGRYTMSGGILKYSLPVIPSKEFKITSDSYVEWTGKIDNPKLNLIAKDRVRASVSEADGSSHMVNFDVIIGAKNRLDNLELIFDLNSPENASVQNQLASMGKEERSKQAIAMLATGVYLAGGSDGKGKGIDMGVALNSVLQSQINAIAGSSLKNASLSVGVEEYDMADTGGKRTDYSFRYSQQFLNNRFQIVVGGRIKTGVESENNADSFIDNISLEYRLDSSGTRFVRVFHNKNYESVLEGEITETGVGVILRKKLNKLGELFIFKKKKKQNNVRGNEE